MGDPKVEIIPFGERGILLNWPESITDSTLFKVLNFKNLLKDKYIKQKVYINSTYSSISIYYDITINKIYDEISRISEWISEVNDEISGNYNLIEIPVCYDKVFGIDLERISERNGLSVDQIIQLHTSIDYRVFFIGFLPGFLYLGGLDDQLVCPRLSTPRQNIEEGSVAIGGSQTGIYPKSSPGGWNIIGRSPLNFFNLENDPPAIACAGDKVRFVSIDMETFRKIETQVKLGTYQVKKEKLDD